ncbi:hypothetical protein EJB05_02725, partial [Eragrostis curvula]
TTRIFQVSINRSFSRFDKQATKTFAYLKYSDMWKTRKIGDYVPLSVEYGPKILVSLGADFWGPFSIHQAVHPCLHLCDIIDAKLVACVLDINTKEMITDVELRCSPCGADDAGVPRLSDNGIHFLTGVCRKLKSVRLINCSSLTEKAATIIASNCPALQNLMMFWSSITDDCVSQILESLTLGSCRQIGEDAIMSFLLDHAFLDKFKLKDMMAESHI